MRTMQKNGMWLMPLVLAVALLFSGLGMAQEQEDESEAPEQWFSVDSLNAGLGEAPEEVKRLTPRDSIRSFQALAEEQDFAAAAHILNLSKIEEGVEGWRGPLLARQLAEVVGRGEWLNAYDLAGRQAAAIDDPAGQHPL